MTWVDDFLNRITMYRLVLYYLLVLLGLAFFLGLFGIVPYSPANLAFSTLVIVSVSWLSNVVFARVFRAIPNIESVYITGLILTLIITPVAPTDYAGVGFLLFASTWAMAAKYIFAIGKKHVFNPAAFGVALGTLMLTGQGATWWVGGSLPLLPFVFLGGLLIVRKIRRFDLILSFFAVALAAIAFTATGGDMARAIYATFAHSAIFFLGFVMLTEPLTMPPSRGLRVIYGAIVGLLFAPNIHFGAFYLSPELALLIGNFFSYLVSPKGRFMLTLREKVRLADGTYEFVFTSDRPIPFRAGQYVEWTLGHRFADNRGNRRYFTLASAPTEKEVRLGVKFYKPSSSFKRALWATQEGESLTVSHPAGDFVLPQDRKKKLAFIAGGIGITPFRSMINHMIDTNDIRDTVLLYSNKTASEIAYRDVFDVAERAVGMKTVYALTNELVSVPGTVDKIDAALIAREIPDYKERLFFISGPHGMVEAFRTTLTDMGVPRLNIKTDYFPGFA